MEKKEDRLERIVNATHEACIFPMVFAQGRSALVRVIAMAVFVPWFFVCGAVLFVPAVLVLMPVIIFRELAEKPMRG
jgi:hypothetical protein